MEKLTEMRLLEKELLEDQIKAQLTGKPTERIELFLQRVALEIERLERVASRPDC